MTDIVDRYLMAYFRYSVGQRAFEDVCRQIVECTGDADERSQLVDESCRLAIFVSDTSEELEELSLELINELQDEEDRDDDLLNDVTLAINHATEDRARANSYTNQVTYLRIGGTPRKPRKPRVANPFVPLIEDDTDVVDVPDTSVVPDDVPIDDSIVEEPVVDTSDDHVKRFPKLSFAHLGQRFRRRNMEVSVTVDEDTVPVDDIPDDVPIDDTLIEDTVPIEDVQDDDTEIIGSGDAESVSSDDGEKRDTPLTNPLAEESETILSIDDLSVDDDPDSAYIREIAETILKGKTGDSDD